MNSDDLRVFAAFAETLGFTAAAARVHLSQPAVFAIVKRLSADVDAPLYDKRGRNLILTDAGRKLAAHAHDVGAAEAALRREISGDEDDGACVLACGEGALTHVVAEGVAAFARAHPRKLRVVIADGPSAIDLVLQRAAHVAIAADPATGAATHDAAERALITRAIVRSRVVAVATRALFLAHGIDDDDGDHALPLSRLAAVPLLLPPKGRPLRRAVDDAFAARGLEPRVDVEVSSWGALVMLARLGCGAALVNDVVKTGGLVARAVEGLAPVTYKTVSLRRRSPITLELLRAVHGAA